MATQNSDISSSAFATSPPDAQQNNSGTIPTVLVPDSQQGESARHGWPRGSQIRLERAPRDGPVTQQSQQQEEMSSQAAAIVESIHNDPASTQTRQELEDHGKVPLSLLFENDALQDLAKEEYGRSTDVFDEPLFANDSEPDDDDDEQPAGAEKADALLRPLTTEVLVQSQHQKTDLEEYQQELLQCLQEQGIMAFIRKILEPEIQEANTLNGALVSQLEKSAYEIVASTPSSILLPLLTGNIAEAYCDDPATTAAIDAIDARSDKQPVVYIMPLTDKWGRALSGKQATRLARYMKRYAAGSNDPEFNAHAQSIDAQKPGPRAWSWEYNEKGRRKYLETKREGRWRFCEKRANELIYLAERIENLVSQIPDDEMDLPMTVPFVYVGYSKNGDKRAHDHYQHRSSNFIMNAAEAIAMFLFDEQYDLKFLAVYLVFGADQAAPAEIIFTRAAHGYTKTGAGFSHYPAGRSNFSADKIPAEKWNAFVNFAADYSPFFENHKRELIMANARLAEQRSANEAKEKKVKEIEERVRRKQEEASKIPSPEQKEILDAAEQHAKDCEAKRDVAKIELERANAVAINKERFLDLVEYLLGMNTASCRH
ncbi:hypothetical protein NA57DRAFT_72596 [Rhizodiscina lignyota]|uniref:Uncharacterized protein n=1 Tax=Rhizodiscina lignyota TaxID=1504668 RepID=A0A9P4MDM9_9PEZI|nr:hypothetical protein NA57DRAFT_72596 [Rhizodiscina lignyota]